MDEKELAQFNRHDFVIISKAGRERICTELLPNYSAAIATIVRDVFSNKYGDAGIPGIVRRAKVANELSIPLGFVPLERLEERRLRIGTFANFAEVMNIVTLYKLLQMPFECRNNCLQAASQIAIMAQGINQAIGILGSAGLEIFTGCHYTNGDSDIDLVIQGCDYKTIVEIYNQLKGIGRKYNMPIDLEIALNNGYGVKAAELFMDTKTLLGKSLDNVILLERKTVLQALTKKERYYNGN